MATRRTPGARGAAAAAARQRLPFTASLLLPRVFAGAFGLRENDLLATLRQADPGRDAAGISGCARALGALAPGAVAPDALRRWDLAIGGHEAAIGAARAAADRAEGGPAQPFRLTYFQWLAAAVVEWHLEGSCADAAAHVAAIEAVRQRDLPHLPPYTAADARKLACFMATGAGKTLVLHLNLRQFIAHRLFTPQQVLLLTPSEALSRQHEQELQRSGLGAAGVRVVEITKFYVDAPGARRPKKGVSEPTSRYEGPNLLLVDEGHKGGSSGGERDWKAIRDALAAGATDAQAGFTFEYSATFAQIADKDDELYDEYARCVALDFGYRRFWSDGYGKQPRQINAGSAAGADFTLAAGLLAFVQQRLAWAEHPALAADYQIAAPLLACVGGKVTAGDSTSDVAVLLGFLARASSDRAWLAARFDEVLTGGEPAQAGFGLPPLDLRWLRQTMAAKGWGSDALAGEAARCVFGGCGTLTVHAVAADELGLKCAGAADDAYFGLIRVGETRKLAEILGRHGIATVGAPDRLTTSLFARIDADPRLTTLIGAKMFIEGWSSWRVSALGLMNVGRNPGAEIVQLFGRGVRLRGRGFSLKRDDDAPLAVQVLQGLQVFGVRADYLQRFVEMLASEGVKPQTLHVLLDPAAELGGSGLQTLALADDRFAGVVAFDAERVPRQHLNVDPQIRVSVGLAGARDLGAAPLRQSLAGFVDAETAYQHALNVKRNQRLVGLVFSARSLLRWLADCDVCAPPGWFEHPALGRARRLSAALEALDAGLVRAWRQAERRWRMDRLALTPLTEANAGLPRAVVAGEPRPAWTLEIDVAREVSDAVMGAVRQVVEQGLASEQLIADVQAVLAHHGAHLLDLVPRVQKLIEDRVTLLQDDLSLPLPRLHGLPHLFTPLLADSALPSAAPQPGRGEQLGLFDAAAWTPSPVRIRPPPLNPGETRFVWDLRAWWERHHDRADWCDVRLFLLRNPAAGGLRLYRDNGFAPDFMVWLQRGAQQALALVDPKGLAREWPQDKLDLIADLEARPLGVPVRGALLSVTLPDDVPLPPGQARDPDSLWSARVLLQSDADHLARLMNHLRAALDAVPLP